MKLIVLLLLHDGFEEMEAIVPWDWLIRSQMEVRLVSITKSLQVMGAHGLKCTADCLFSEIKDYQTFEGVIVPGGPGVFKILDREDIAQCIQTFTKAKKCVGAICAAPLLLKKAGVLPQKFTAHPSVEKDLPSCDGKNSVVICDRFVTANGPQAAFEFACALLEVLLSGNKVKN